MKILFWSVLILGTIWWLMKKTLGTGNDLTNHLNEQKALQSIGDSALGANQVGTGNWPLATIGQTALAGISLNPFDASSPFNAPNTPTMYQSTPATSDNSNPYSLLLY